MEQLGWEQLHSWRIARHRLPPRATSGATLDVVRSICGLHAQLLPAAEPALWARTEWSALWCSQSFRVYPPP